MNLGSLHGAPFEESALEQFVTVMHTGPLDCYLAMRALLPGMLERREGCILHLASGSGVSGSPGFALFSASEFALIGTSDKGADPPLTDGCGLNGRAYVSGGAPLQAHWKVKTRPSAVRLAPTSDQVSAVRVRASL